MICKKCGAVIAADAKFCPHCGENQEKYAYCTTCGKLIEQDSLYCVHCGARTDGKKPCRHCGYIHDGVFCPKCGRNEDGFTADWSEPILQKTKSDECGTPVVEPAKKEKSKLTVAFGWMSDCSALFAAVLAYVFLFFIGLDRKNDVGGNNIFYYIYDVVKDLLSYRTGDVFDVGGYIVMAISCATASLAIVFSTIFLIRAIVGFFSGIKAGKDSDATKYALNVTFTYFITAGILFGISVFYHNGLSNVQVEFNGATIFGLTVVCLNLLFSAVMKTITKGKATFSKKTLVNVVGVHVLVPLLFMVFTIVEYTGFEYEYRTTSGDVSMSIPFIYAARFVSVVGQTQGEQIAVYFFGAAITIIGLLILVLSGMAMKKQFSMLMSDTKKDGFGLSVAVLVLSGVYLSCAVVFAWLAKMCWDTGSTVAFSPCYDSAIALMVFAMLQFVAMIVMRILRKKRKED